MRFPVVSVVGARPNFMKVAPVLRELIRHPAFESFLVHTGQHYDDAMSAAFLRDLEMRNPDFDLKVGSASHAVQTADIMRGFEEVCRTVKPRLVLVAGDVNSTLACALTAAKLQIPVAHIEAGLRSFDRTMPEEINRVVTDAVAELLFTTEDSGNRHLCREGIAPAKIHWVGNTMIDSLLRCFSLLEKSAPDAGATRGAARNYLVATVHRPSNVDNATELLRVMGILKAASQLAPLFFVTHPRTRARLRLLNAADPLIELCDRSDDVEPGRVYLLPPVGYIEFLQLMAHSTAVLTDSGGIQEETTFLKIPCLTLRDNTERPSTVELGTNEIVGLDRQKILFCLERILMGRWKKGVTPPLWDGRAAERVVDILVQWSGSA